MPRAARSLRRRRRVPDTLLDTLAAQRATAATTAVEWRAPRPSCSACSGRARARRRRRRRALRRSRRRRHRSRPRRRRDRHAAAATPRRRALPPPRRLERLHSPASPPRAPYSTRARGHPAVAGPPSTATKVAVSRRLLGAPAAGKRRATRRARLRSPRRRRRRRERRPTRRRRRGKVFSLESNLFAKIVNRTRTDLYRGRGIVAPGASSPAHLHPSSSIDRIHLLSSSVLVGSRAAPSCQSRPRSWSAGSPASGSPSSPCCGSAA